MVSEALMKEFEEFLEWKESQAKLLPTPAVPKTKKSSRLWETYDPKTNPLDAIIHPINEKHGVTINQNSSRQNPRVIKALGSLRKIADKQGGKILDQVYELVFSQWPDDMEEPWERTEGTLLEALADLIAEGLAGRQLEYALRGRHPRVFTKSRKKKDIIREIRSDYQFFSR